MNLLDRAKAIIVSPATEWQVIDREPGDTGFLFGNYVAILAAIPAVCGFIGWVVLGVPVLTALLIALTRYVMSFVMVYVVAFIIEQIAPSFGGRRDFESALKLAVFAATPVWLAGVFLLVPGLGFLAILGLYAVYLLWTGIPPLMHAPGDRALVYTVAVVLCVFVVAALLGVAVSLVVGFRPIM